MSSSPQVFLVQSNSLDFAEAGPLKYRSSTPFFQHVWNFFFTQNSDGTWSNIKANYAGKEVDGGLGVINVGPENTPVYGIVADPQDAKWNLGRMTQSPYFSNAIPYLPGTTPAASPVSIGGTMYLRVGPTSSSLSPSMRPTQLQHAYSKEGLSLVSLQAHRSGSFVSFSDSSGTSQGECTSCTLDCLRTKSDVECKAHCGYACGCSCRYSASRS